MTPEEIEKKAQEIAQQLLTLGPKESHDRFYAIKEANESLFVLVRKAMLEQLN